MMINNRKVWMIFGTGLVNRNAIDYEAVTTVYLSLCLTGQQVTLVILLQLAAIQVY